MSILDNQSATLLNKGIIKDNTYAPEGSLTFALNAIRDSYDGGRFQYQSEPGNEWITDLPENSSICGWIYGKNNEIYLLLKNGNDSEIGIFKEGQYQTVVVADLGFDVNYPITGEFRIKNGCERVIYWCDHNQSDYYYNFDRDDLFRDDIGDYDPNLFRLIPKILPPKIDLVKVNDSGGSLPLGSYYFQVEILDESLNSLYKSDITPQTPIIDDDFSMPFNKIDGGLNIEQYTPEIGGVPLSSKSITLRFYNLNTSFSYIRVNVIRQIAGTQVIDAHAVGSLIPIGSSDFTWTYTGYNVSNGDYPVEYRELLVDNIRYETAYVMEQVQGRLIRANLKQAPRDYSNYQRVSSQIDTRWVASEVRAEDQNDIGNPKNPHTYWLKTTAQGDEIVALGIQYLHDDGTWSPFFHIPGRPATVTDVENLFVIDNASSPSSLLVRESDVKHLNESDFSAWAGDYVGSNVRRWKVFNTASYTQSNTASHPYSYEGLMGYYESDATYPDIVDCDGNSVWGQDSEGNEISSLTKIRHHRIPDRRLVRHWTGYDDEFGEYIMPIGFKFSNIVYPSSDVIGHRFGIVERDDFNKTVLDSGWFSKEKDDQLINFGDESDDTLYGIEATSMLNTTFDAGDPGQVTGKYGVYLSANTIHNRKIFNPDYLKFNHAHDFKINGGLWNGDGIFPLGATVPRTGGGSINVVIYHVRKNTDPMLTDRQNYKIENQVFVPENGFISESAYDINVHNHDAFTPLNVVKGDYEFENYDDTIYSGWWIAYAYKKNNIKPYESLFTLNYKYLHLNYETSGDADDNVFYGGDSIISSSAPAKLVAAYPDDGVFSYAVNAHIDFYEEHQLNAALRHEGTDERNKYYKADGNHLWMLPKIAERQDDGSWDPYYKVDILPEYYAYNIDFTKQYNQMFKGVLPLTYNYCNYCLNEYRNRIVFSPKSFDEEVFDMYRLNKVNDYIDVPGHRGAITGLKYKNNVLLVHCEEGSFILQPNPQALTSNFSNVYLTTGDFLGIPPAELLQTDVGYAGCKSKQHQCDTPEGWCWVDQLRSQVFKYDNKLNEISKIGLSSWFSNNIPSQLNSAFYEIYLEDYDITSTLNIGSGVGIILYYDPKFNRLLITKKDYLPINFQQRSISVGEVSYDFEANSWQVIDEFGDLIRINFKDTEFFENKSWTLSYSFDYEDSEISPWTSWHSYIPPFAFWDNYHYYTFETPSETNDVRSIYQHKYTDHYQEYYWNKYDFIIEWQVYNHNTQDFNAIYYSGYSLKWDDTNEVWEQIDETFYKGLVYNYNQSTGIFDLEFTNVSTNPYVNVGFSNTTKYIIRTDNNYKISGLYDLATASPVMTSDWNVIKNNYYIDAEPLVSNIDTNKSQYNLNNFRDKFVKCRLFYNPSDDCKKVINLIQNNSSISIR